MGSRFGGIKQITPVGQNGELIIDYSIYDAVKSGVKKIVFVIRPDIKKEFDEVFYNRLKKQIGDKVELTYCFQDIPAGRNKPLGTADAVLAGKDYINEQFIVINADDYYGQSAFQTASKIKGNAIVMYDLQNTMAYSGDTSRGIVYTDDEGNIVDIVDNVIKKSDIGTLYAPDTKVNMNFFVLTPAVMEMLMKLKTEFLVWNNGNPTGEFGLPQNIAKLVKNGKIKLQALESRDNWIGMTYKQDRDIVVASMKKLVDGGAYPNPLWK